MRPPPEQEDSHRCYADTHDSARANRCRAETRGQLDPLVPRLPVISASQYNSRGCCRKGSPCARFHSDRSRTLAPARRSAVHGHRRRPRDDHPAVEVAHTAPLPRLSLAVSLAPVAGYRVLRRWWRSQVVETIPPPVHRRAHRRSSERFPPVGGHVAGHAR